MDDSPIAFKDTLQQLLEKVEKVEMVPKLQASHAPPRKFWTALQVINGIRHMAPVIHGSKGCTCSVANAYKMRGCEYRGVPLEPTYHGAAITLDTYSHVLPGIQAAAAGGFDEGLQKAAEKALSERVG